MRNTGLYPNLSRKLASVPNSFPNFLLLLLFILIPSFSFSAPFAEQSSQQQFQDDFCKSHLLGTMSKESCFDACGEKACKIIQTHKAEGIDCYGCAAAQSCYDLGLLPKFPDCFICEMNPKKICVNSIPVKNPLGFGPGAIPLPKTALGEQCYDCIDKPKQCKDIWPASTPKAACEAGCKKKDHICVQVGINPDDGVACFECKHFPPVEMCKDLGFLSKPQCGTCKADEDCVAVPGAVTKSKEQCFQCVKRKAPPPPPPPAEKCEDFGWQTPSCDCSEDEMLITDQLGTNGELQCCRCVKNDCRPDMHKSECKEKCEDKGGQCIGKTRTKDDPDCYSCYFPKKEQEPQSCQDLAMPQSCNPFPCLSGDTCEIQAIPLKNGKTLECAQCVPGDIDPGDCSKYRAFPHCAWCYRSGMACEMQKVQPDPPLWCAKCLEASCIDKESLPGTCAQVSCPSGEECITTDDGCHYCQKKPKCEDDELYSASDCSGACNPEKETCEQAFKFNDDPLTCYECVKKDVCDDHAGYFSDGACAGSCKANQTCEKEPADEFFDVDCWFCKDKPTIEEKTQCDGGFSPGKCPGNCSLTQNCVQAGECFSCEEKDLTPLCPEGEMDGRCSKGVCGDDMICVPTSSDCYKCERPVIKDDQPPPPPPPVECPSGASKGFCPGSCSSEQECIVAGEDCYRCIKKRKSCEDMGMSDGETCIKACNEKGGTCFQKGGDDFGTNCWECRTKDDCPLGSVKGPCFGSGIGCGWDHICEQTDEWCHKCVPIKEYWEKQPCPDGGIKGECPGSCSADQECVMQGKGCYSCQPKEKKCADYEMLDSCIPCQWQLKDCADVSPAPGLTCKECKENKCYPEFLSAKDCRDCEWDGGVCVPAHAGTRVRGEPECFRCVEEDECEDYGEVCSCMDCRPGTICVPTERLISGKMCYQCIRPKTISITYVVTIVETPYGRFVLNKKDVPALGGLSGFTPTSVMALAGVSQSPQGAMQLLGMPNVPAPEDILKKALGLDKIAEGLQKALATGKKFTDDCFKDFPAISLPQTPPLLSTPKQAKANGFGQDSMNQATTGGPLVACGNIDGKKALAIFDANGAPVETILQDQLKKNPDSLMQALQKAQEINSNIFEMRASGVKGILKNVIEAASEKDLWGNASGKVTPNDPLYQAPEAKKKKKLLGIIGSSKDSAAVNIGSIQRMGTGVIGMGSGAKAHEESDIKDQWGLREIGYLPKSDAQSAWNIEDGSTRNVIVAVIDSGLDMTHPDGPQYIWKNPIEKAGNNIDDDLNGYVDDITGWNFLDNNSDLIDEKGHGTFVAGIIAAKTNNGIGIAGINPGAVIMPLKVADAQGKTNSFAIFRAVHYAVNHGARVINISLGARGISKLEQLAINYAQSMGVFVAVAAGNVNEDIKDHGPASIPGAFAVGSIDFEGNRSTISNWGANNGIVAPGEEIYSLLSKDIKEGILPSIKKFGYYKQSGTSFSTPMVSATASLMLAKNPNLSPKQIEDILQRSAGEMYTDGWDGQSGAGLLNAAAAINEEVRLPVTVKINQINVNYNNRGNLDSLDVFGTVRGDFSEFKIELGKGKEPGRFVEVTGAYSQEADRSWIARVDEKNLRGSDEWVVRIHVKGKDGKSYFAQSPFMTKK